MYHWHCPWIPLWNHEIYVLYKAGNPCKAFTVQDWCLQQHPGIMFFVHGPRVGQLTARLSSLVGKTSFAFFAVFAFGLTDCGATRSVPQDQTIRNETGAILISWSSIATDPIPFPTSPLPRESLIPLLFHCSVPASRDAVSVPGPWPAVSRHSCPQHFTYIFLVPFHSYMSMWLETMVVKKAIFLSGYIWE